MSSGAVTFLQRAMVLFSIHMVEYNPQFCLGQQLKSQFPVCADLGFILVHLCFSCQLEIWQSLCTEFWFSLLQLSLQCPWLPWTPLSCSSGQEYCVLSADALVLPLGTNWGLPSDWKWWKWETHSLLFPVLHRSHSFRICLLVAFLDSSWGAWRSLCKSNSGWFRNGWETDRGLLILSELLEP